MYYHIIYYHHYYHINYQNIIIFKFLYYIWINISLLWLLLLIYYCFNNLISGVSGETSETDLMKEAIKWNNWGLHRISWAVKMQPLINIFFVFSWEPKSNFTFDMCAMNYISANRFCEECSVMVGWMICWLQHNDIWRKWPRLWAENKHEVKKHAWQISC